MPSVDFQLSSVLVCHLVKCIRTHIWSQVVRLLRGHHRPEHTPGVSLQGIADLEHTCRYSPKSREALCSKEGICRPLAQFGEEWVLCHYPFMETIVEVFPHNAYAVGDEEIDLEEAGDNTEPVECDIRDDEQPHPS